MALEAERKAEEEAKKQGEERAKSTAKWTASCAVDDVLATVRDVEAGIIDAEVYPHAEGWAVKVPILRDEGFFDLADPIGHVVVVVTEDGESVVRAHEPAWY